LLVQEAGPCNQRRGCVPNAKGSRHGRYPYEGAVDEPCRTPGRGDRRSYTWSFKRKAILYPATAGDAGLIRGENCVSEAIPHSDECGVRSMPPQNWNPKVWGLWR